MHPPKVFSAVCHLPSVTTSSSSETPTSTDVVVVLLIFTDPFAYMFDRYANTYFYKPFTNDFPRADIHELLSPDLLHQVIKGTFKDHLVTWVEEYLVLTHGKARADEIMADIDKR